MKTPDELCLNTNLKGKKLRIRINDENVILEGDNESLHFLADLIAAQAESDVDCSFSIEPRGAGHEYFESASDFGITIHKLPCTEHK